MNELEQFFYEQDHRLIHKYKHYFEIYHRHLQHFRNKNIVILEFGVSHGGSLQMWRHYFGDKAVIYGVDINPECKKFEEGNIKIIIGSQEDKDFLARLQKEIPSIDILIDDGGHTMRQQKLTFDHLFDSINENGVFIGEDLHTSYWPSYGGGFRRPGSFIEYSKRFIDYLNLPHIQKKFGSKPTEFNRSVHSMHYYDSVLVIEKRARVKPEALELGTGSLNMPFVMNKSSYMFNLGNWYYKIRKSLKR
jgi:hypothetical protein